MNFVYEQSLVHRKRSMGALRSLLGFPQDTPQNAGLAFAAVDAPTDAILTTIAHQAIGSGQDTLVQCFANTAAEDAILTFLVLRTPTGAELLPVEAIEIGKDKPLQLITANRTRCFKLDSRLQVCETKAPPASKLRKALAGASARYEAALARFDDGETNWDPPVVVFERNPASLAA